MTTLTNCLAFGAPSGTINDFFTTGDVGGRPQLMTERGLGKPWTPVEDSLLKAAVSQFGDHDNWKNVATLVPGRTNKACRKVRGVPLGDLSDLQHVGSSGGSIR